MELTLKEVEVAKLDLQPGQILAVTVKSPELISDDLASLQRKFSSVFPNNRVMIFGLGEDDSVKFSVLTEVKAEPAKTPSYCTDCSCGKKEQAEGK